MELHAVLPLELESCAKSSLDWISCFLQAKDLKKMVRRPKALERPSSSALVRHSALQLCMPPVMGSWDLVLSSVASLKLARTFSWQSKSSSCKRLSH